jgi:CubicO group peptidase (beta-lactamase class C family)
MIDPALFTIFLLCIQAAARPSPHSGCDRLRRTIVQKSGTRHHAAAARRLQCAHRPFDKEFVMFKRSFLVTALVASAAWAQAPDPLPRATPESQGMSARQLERVGATVRALIDQERMAGAVVGIARNGKLVYLEAFGWQDKAADVRMARDSIFAIASMTKPIVAVGALILQEENWLHLNDPVGAYLPELQNLQVIDGQAESAKPPFKTVAARRKPTLQDLMRHTAGMTYGNRGTGELFAAWPSGSLASAQRMSGPEFLARLAALPLHYQPGARWDYGLGFDVLGFAMEAAAKQPLEEILTSRIFKPLRMTDTGFVLPPEKFGRFSRPLADPKTGRLPPTYDARKGSKFQCGGACLVSTVPDYLRFYQMMLDRGALDGTRIVGRKSIEYMTSNQLGDSVDRSALNDYPNIDGYGFGLGVAVRQMAGVAGVMGSPGDYHWHGAAGSLAWVDPRENLVAVFMAQSPGPIRFQNRRTFNALVYQALN